MMSRNSENNYHGNNTINEYFNSNHIIQSDLYVPSMHKKCDCPATNNNTNKNHRNQFGNRSGQSDELLVKGNYFRLNHFIDDHLHKFNSTEQFCENCGYLQHKDTKTCDLCGYNFYHNNDIGDDTILLSTIPPPLYKNENIYENICEVCGLIYSADKCEHCTKKVTYGSLRKNKQLNIFSGLIDNIRQRTKSKSKPKRKLPTIEIVHNVDGVFRTNKTFDLNEICRLKSNLSSSNHQVYGKLRKSDECITNSFQHHTNVRSFGSDLNYTHRAPSNDLLSNIKAHSISLNNSPIYENLKTFIYSTVSPAFNNDITDNSLIYWLTSLKKHTNDYNDETVYNVKCIPSNSFSDCCNYHRSNGERLTSESEFNLNKIEDFKNSLMENQSKRKAIYFKEEKHYEPILVVVKDNNYLFDSSSSSAAEETTTEIPLNISESSNYVDDQQHVNEEFPSDCSFLRPKNFQFRSEIVDIIEVKRTTTTGEPLVPVISKSTALLPCHKVNTTNTPKKRKRQIITTLLSVNRLLFSIALNRTVITYDRDFITFLNNITKNRKNFKSFIKSASSIAENPIVKRAKSLKSKFSDFEKPTKQCTDSSSAKKQINDFEIKSTVLVDNQRRLEDFEKLKPSSQLRKQLSDFELKHKGIVNVSTQPSAVHRKAIAFGDRMNSKALSNDAFDDDDIDAENIYQPIWKFQTVGYAKENYIADVTDVCFESQSNGIDDDIGEWELDDEFAYSTKLCADDDYGNRNVSHGQDQYQSVCILYNFTDPKLNQLIYETDHKFGYNDYKRNCGHLLSPIVEEDGFSFGMNNRPTTTTTTESSLFPLPSPVQAWKIMLWNVNYMEDEEDLVSGFNVMFR